MSDMGMKRISKQVRVIVQEHILEQKPYDTFKFQNSKIFQNCFVKCRMIKVSRNPYISIIYIFSKYVFK